MDSILVVLFDMVCRILDAMRTIIERTADRLFLSMKIGLNNSAKLLKDHMDPEFNYREFHNPFVRSPNFVKWTTASGNWVLYKNPILILEYDQPLAITVAYYRWELVVLLKVFTVGFMIRMLFPLWGYNPYDGFIIEAWCRVYDPLLYLLAGYFPTVMGIPTGALVALHVFERLQWYISRIIILDHFGNVFMGPIDIDKFL